MVSVCAFTVQDDFLRKSFGYWNLGFYTTGYYNNNHVQQIYKIYYIFRPALGRLGFGFWSCSCRTN